MKYFAEFYRAGVTTGAPTPVCGNDGIVDLDGRKSLYNIMDAMEAHSKSKGYLAYQIVKGETYTRQTRPVTPLMYV